MLGHQFLLAGIRTRAAVAEAKVFGRECFSSTVEGCLREKKGKWCKIVAGPQTQNLTFYVTFFTLARLSENVYCYPKMGQKN